MPASRPAASLARQAAHAQQRPSCALQSPDSSSSSATSPAMPPRRASAWATKFDLAFDCGRGDDQFVVEAAFLVEQTDERGGQLLDAACRVVARRALAHWPRTAVGRPPPTRRAATSSRRSAAAIDWTSASAPRRAADRRSASRHWPKRSRRRPRAMISAIAAAATAPSPWLTRPWIDARVAPAGARLGSGRDPLLVGAAQQHAERGRLGRAARPRQQRRSARGCPRRSRRGDVRQQPREARRRCRRPGNAASPSSARVPARVRRSAGSRKKSTRTVDSRSRPARRAGAFWSAAERSDRPFFRHHLRPAYPICVNFASTRGECRTCWTMKKDDRGIDEKRDEIGCPRAAERERDRGDDRACGARIATDPPSGGMPPSRSAPLRRRRSSAAAASSAPSRPVAHLPPGQRQQARARPPATARAGSSFASASGRRRSVARRLATMSSGVERSISRARPRATRE